MTRTSRQNISIANGVISVDNGTISISGTNVTDALGNTPVNTAVSTADIEEFFIQARILFTAKIKLNPKKFP